MILGAVAAASVGCVAAYGLRFIKDAPPKLAPVAAHAPVVIVEDPEKLYGAIIVEPGWAEAGRAPASPPIIASLGPEPPSAPVATEAPATSSVPPSPPPPTAETAPEPAPVAPPAVANALPDMAPLPPIRDVPRIDESVPLPPVRPADLAPLAPVQVAPNTVAPAPAAPDRRVAMPSPGPTDERNVFQKLLGIGQQPGAVVASRPAEPVVVAPSRPASVPAPTAAPAAPTTTVVAKPAAADARSGFAGLFSGFSAVPKMDHLGYDRQTAIYDISARTVYLPDGTRLEAHSGLGAALDNVRYVSERAIGPTPPHMYELRMRESLFHGVQAIRLNPVGDGALYGRDGFLAHPYMLGENGDSNGCVSVKDYDAFLRAYQNGQITKLAVVSRL